MKTLQEIYQPIIKELALVETELKNVLFFCGHEGRATDDSKQVIEYFFNVPGKRFRPALVILSACAVNYRLSTTGYQPIHLAAIVELIHTASLIHDDIVDDSSSRRGQPTLNKQFGNKIAVLAGDMLYTRAFSLLTDKYDKKIIRILSQCVEKMCGGEINELLPADGKLRTAFPEYLKIIENKTASFMAACCQCGAELNSASKKLIDGLTDYGLNLGMTYQIVDDYIDGDFVNVKDYHIKKAEEFASKAKQSIKVLKNSIYKEKLFDLVDYILNISRR